MSVSIFINVEKLIWLAVINAVKAEAQVLGVVQSFSWSLVCLVVKFVDYGVVEGIKRVGARTQTRPCLVFLLPVSKDFIHKGVVKPEDWVKCCNLNYSHRATESFVDSGMVQTKGFGEVTSKIWLPQSSLNISGKMRTSGPLRLNDPL